MVSESTYGKARGLPQFVIDGLLSKVRHIRVPELLIAIPRREHADHRPLHVLGEGRRQEGSSGGGAARQGHCEGQITSRSSLALVCFFFDGLPLKPSVLKERFRHRIPRRKEMGAEKQARIGFEYMRLLDGYFGGGSI